MSTVTYLLALAAGYFYHTDDVGAAFTCAALGFALAVMDATGIFKNRPEGG